LHLIYLSSSTRSYNVRNASGWSGEQTGKRTHAADHWGFKEVNVPFRISVNILVYISYVNGNKLFPLTEKQLASSRQAPCVHGALDLEFSSEKIISGDSTDILRPSSLFRGFPIP